MGKQHAVLERMRILLLLALTVGLGSGCGESSGKLRSLESALAETQAQLVTATTQVTSLRAQLATAQKTIDELSPLAAKARTLPIRVQRVQTGGSTNAVYQLQNLSSQTLAVKVKLRNTTYQYSKSLTCALPAMRPAPAFEIGPANNWPAAAGDVLEMSSQGYDDLTIAY